MERIKTIQINAKEIKKDKQTFIACSAKIGNNWYNIKFRQECEISPKQKGIYELTIDLNNCSMETGKYFTKEDGTTNKRNDTIWVKKVNNLRKFNEEEMQDLNATKFENIEW